MKTIFDTIEANMLIERAKLLTPNHKALWGKMDCYQMLKHCNMSEAMYHGKNSYKRLFIGRLFGAMALKGILKNTAPMKRNQPTHPTFKISGSGDFEAEKQLWIKQLNDYKQAKNLGMVHPFFGAMSHHQIGMYVYKHTDHHLRQFGV